MRNLQIRKWIISQIRKGNELRKENGLRPEKRARLLRALPLAAKGVGEILRALSLALGREMNVGRGRDLMLMGGD